MKPHVGTALQEFLDQISETIADDEKAIMFANQVGWDRPRRQCPTRHAHLAAVLGPRALNLFERLRFWLTERFLPDRRLEQQMPVDAACSTCDNLSAKLASMPPRRSILGPNG